MSWRRILSIFIGIGSLLIPLPLTLGDTITTEDTDHFGWILEMNASGVSFQKRCDPNQGKSMPWSQIKSINFDKKCDSSVYFGKTYRTGLKCGDTVPAFIITFYEDNIEVCAKKVTLDANTFQIVLFNNRTLSCTAGRARVLVKYLTHTAICRDEVRKNAPSPDGMNLH